MTQIHSTMPIDRDTFENTSEDELEELSVPDQALRFLAANDNHVFKAREIPSQIGLDEGAVSTALSRLNDRGLVEHKATHWSVTDDAECLNGYSGYERATALFNDQLGAEDKESWREHVPQQSHPNVENEQLPTKRHQSSIGATSSTVMIHSKATRTLGPSLSSRITGDGRFTATSILRSR
jgi:hypothetical protein